MTATRNKPGPKPREDVARVVLEVWLAQEERERLHVAARVAGAPSTNAWARAVLGAEASRLRAGGRK
jgi:hypothetical protein